MAGFRGFEPLGSVSYIKVLLLNQCRLYLLQTPQQPVDTARKQETINIINLSPLISNLIFKSLLIFLVYETVVPAINNATAHNMNLFYKFIILQKLLKFKEEI